MTLLLGYIKSIMTIRAGIFAIEKYSNILTLTQKKDALRNQLDIIFMVVEKLSYFHQMNFIHMHQLTYMSNSISFFGVLEKITSKICLLMVVM